MGQRRARIQDLAPLPKDPKRRMLKVRVKKDLDAKVKLKKTHKKTHSKLKLVVTKKTKTQS